MQDWYQNWDGLFGNIITLDYSRDLGYLDVSYVSSWSWIGLTSSTPMALPSTNTRQLLL
jgi:hypothetical protein